MVVEAPAGVGFGSAWDDMRISFPHGIEFAMRDCQVGCSGFHIGLETRKIGKCCLDEHRGLNSWDGSKSVI